MNKITIIYTVVILVLIGYLLVIEGVPSSGFRFTAGGHDNLLSFFDITYIFIVLAAIALVAISFLAYKRKPDTKILLVSFAFLLFSVHIILEAVDNFFLGSYRLLGIANKILELMVLLTFIIVLLKK